MMSGGTALLVVILGLFPAAGRAEAFLEEGAATASGPTATSRPQPEKVLESVLAVYIRKMTDAVEVTEEQGALIFPRLQEAFQARWRSAQQRHQLLLLMERANSSPGTAGVEQLLSQWEENEAKLSAGQRQMLDISRTVLRPEQQVKFLLFEERFQNDLVRSMGQIRRGQVQRSIRKRAQER